MTEQQPDRPRAIVVNSAALLYGAECLGLYRLIQPVVAQHQRDGARIRPEMRQAYETVRAVALEHLASVSRANGHADTSTADIGASCLHDLISTADLAAKLGVTARHARRLAEAEGIAPVARNRWRAQDVAALVVTRAEDRRT